MRLAAARVANCPLKYRIVTYLTIKSCVPF